MTAIKLRDYQRETIDAVFSAWSEGVRRPAVVLPTGAGKTVVFAHLVGEFQLNWDVLGLTKGREVVAAPGQRVIILVHRDELADQAMNKLRQVLPEGVSVGKVKAEANDVLADVMVCSVQTLAVERRRTLLVRAQHVGEIGLIITDECHHAAAASYRKVYDAFPDALQLGVTATLERNDGKSLGDVWDDVVYSKSILWMIAKGYLTDVRAKAVDVAALDMSDVKRTGGDWAAGDLGRALEESGALGAVTAAYQAHGEGRRAIVFTPTVATAEAVHADLNAAGTTAGVISAATPRGERLRLFEDFRTGRTQVLVNCMVLTEGFDAPWAEVAIIARPTQSRALYTQMVGRVLRPWEGKRDALVLDLVGASANGLRTLIDLEPGAVRKMRDGETLADAVIREAEEGGHKVAAGHIAFELKVRDLDVFAASPTAWHRTRGGIMFIDVGKSMRVLLWPSPEEAGKWDVCAQLGAQIGRTPYRALDLSMALAWGEAKAEDNAEFSTRRSAKWRKGPPSEAQLKVAGAWGLETKGLSKGAVADLLSVEAATRDLDPYLSRG